VPPLEKNYIFDEYTQGESGKRRVRSCGQEGENLDDEKGERRVRSEWMRCGRVVKRRVEEAFLMEGEKKETILSWGEKNPVPSIHPKRTSGTDPWVRAVGRKRELLSEGEKRSRNEYPTKEGRRAGNYAGKRGCYEKKKRCHRPGEGGKKK